MKTSETATAQTRRRLLKNTAWAAGAAALVAAKRCTNGRRHERATALYELLPFGLPQ